MKNLTTSFYINKKPENLMERKFPGEQA